MDVGKIQRLNNLIGEYKEFNIDEDPAKAIQADESPDISEHDKVLRKIHFRTVYNEEEIKNLKGMIGILKGEIKDLRDRNRQQVPVPVQREEPEVGKEERQQVIKEVVDINELDSGHVAIEDYFYCGVR